MTSWVSIASDCRFGYLGREHRRMRTPHVNRQSTSVIRTWLIQGAIGALLVLAWLLVRDPTSVVAYPLTCTHPTPAGAACTGWRTLEREYFRIDVESAQVIAWVDRPMARAARLTDCTFEDLASWSCSTHEPGVRVGLRDGLGIRQIDAVSDPGRTYVGWFEWWWTWLLEVLLGRSADMR